MSDDLSIPRGRLLARLAEHLAAVRLDHPVRVAIDGVDGAGKSTLADDLVQPLEARGRPVIRASCDGFHRPRWYRYRRGADSPQGYYLDSFDYEALKANLLLPLGPEGDRRYRPAIFDFASDSPVDLPWQLAPADAVLLLDGVFLLRPALNPHWDLRIFLDVDFETAVARAARRDAAPPGSFEAVAARYWRRYVPGQQIYLREVRPQALADVIVDNRQRHAGSLDTRGLRPPGTTQGGSRL